MTSRRHETTRGSGSPHPSSRFFDVFCREAGGRGGPAGPPRRLRPGRSGSSRAAWATRRCPGGTPCSAHRRTDRRRKRGPGSGRYPRRPGRRRWQESVSSRHSPPCNGIRSLQWLPPAGGSNEIVPRCCWSANAPGNRDSAYAAARSRNQPAVRWSPSRSGRGSGHPSSPRRRPASMTDRCCSPGLAGPCWAWRSLPTDRASSL